MIEMALVLPLLVFLMMALLWLAVAAASRVQLTVATYEAGRMAAAAMVMGSKRAPVELVRDALLATPMSLAPERLRVLSAEQRQVHGQGLLVVETEYQVTGPLGSPLRLIQQTAVALGP